MWQPYANNCTLTDANIHAAVDLWLENGFNAAIQYGDISGWDVSRVTQFSHLFDASRNKAARRFNADLSGWNMSQATNLSSCF